jgi:hypothetical protein
MARTQSQQSVAVFVVVLVLLTGYFAIDAVAVLFHPPGTRTPHPGPVREINDSALLAVIAWCIAGAFPVRGLFSRRFPAVGARCGRLLYTWAWALTLLHIAVAFHTAHGWSHARAFDHVERTSGFGPGLYVNYAFAAIWTADVLWSWIALNHYLDRPRWLGRVLVAFMAFIVFNAAVVFGTGPRRLASAGLFLVPLVLIGVAVRNARTRPGPGPGGATGSTTGHSPT